MFEGEVRKQIVEKKAGRVLAVDDEPTMLRLLKINLSKNGFEVVTASDGGEALRILEKDPDFDIALLDVMMPNMNGFQTCRAIREKYSLYQLPVMFVTAKFQVRDIVEGFDIGANDYIVKPFDAKELIARVKTLVKLKKLTAANEALRKAREMSEQFHLMTVHDLKNPLTSIIIRSEFLEKQLDKNSQLFEHASAIKKAAKVMVELLEDFIEMSKIESGKLVLNKTKVDVNKLIMEIIDENLSAAEEKNQSLKFSPGPAGRTYVFGDPQRIREIVDNLVSNAIKYSPLGKPIEIKVKIVEDDGNQSVEISVKDEGQGLTEEDIKNVFSKFKKLSAKPTGKESSTGLGLSIAKELTEAHGGKIWVESQYGEGSVFYVRLPLYEG